MGFAIGVVLFALGIAVSIALHEAGHMYTARAFGMRVRRYFIGFGPTIFSFRKGHTTYGLKAIPFGGFCDIAGMTANDALTEDEKPLAMVNKRWWQRIAVLAGGITMNFVIGVVVLYAAAVTTGLPDPNVDVTATVKATACPAPSVSVDGKAAPCTGPGPAATAGVVAGDKIVAVNDTKIHNFVELVHALRNVAGKTVTLTIVRDGESVKIPVPVAAVTRPVKTEDGSVQERTVGAIGVSAQIPQVIKTYGPVEGLRATASFSGLMVKQSIHGLLTFPEKIPGVVASITGSHRDVDSPMSVVGATRVGGQFAQHNQWSMFMLMLASLNFFLALLNVVPLPPLDGGHIAVIVYEKLRDLLRRARGLSPAGPADYLRLMPLTYAVSAVLLVVGLIVIVADVVNPINL